MRVQNTEIARLLDRYGTLLEIDGANSFRVRAYHNAARTIAELPRSVAEMVEAEEDLTELTGIGQDLAAKLSEIASTGGLRVLRELEARTSKELADLVALPGLGPKRVKVLHDALGVDSLEGLAKAARRGEIRALAGFGVKSEKKLLDAVEQQLGAERRLTLLEAERAAESLLSYLRGIPSVESAEVAGSYRRRRETVGDLDVLVTCAAPLELMEQFIAYPEVADVVSSGTTRSTVRLRQGLQVDLRVVPKASRGAALQYFTGSKAHNIAVRRIAGQGGLKLSEYGLFRGKKRIAGRTEEAVYKRLGLPYIEPELRENRGEIEAARQGRLPELVTLRDVRGDLHCHTKASDGRETISAMAEAAAELGYEYLAISDHTEHLAVARGLDAKRLARQLAEIDRFNAKPGRLKLLKSAEVDILEDGSLDLSDDLLRELDVVTGAVHYAFGLSRDEQTERIIRAMDNPRFNVLAHPSGRLLGKRDAYEIDMERLMRAALERGCYIELNAQPERLDVTDVGCMTAKGLGLKVAISTDAHSTAQLGYMRFGVAQARRGWLERGDVLNTQTWEKLAKLLARS